VRLRGTIRGGNGWVETSCASATACPRAGIGRCRPVGETKLASKNISIYAAPESKEHAPGRRAGSVRPQAVASDLHGFNLQVARNPPIEI
jgi:hypothetical protein